MDGREELVWVVVLSPVRHEGYMMEKHILSEHGIVESNHEQNHPCEGITQRDQNYNHTAESR